MTAPRWLTLVASVALVAGCADTPVASYNDLELAAAAAPKSEGKPEIFRNQFDVTFVIPCQTFDMEAHFVGRSIDWVWFNDDGSARFKFHVTQTSTFTNLSTGDWATADFVVNEEVLDDGSGKLVITNNGVLLKVRREAKGRQIAYRMGHLTLTIDFSTFPPTFESTFNGREEGGTEGPCVALGDPA